MLVNSGNLIVNIREDIFSRYKKISLIGEGSYGRVYKVQNSSNQFRALKVIEKKNDNLNLDEIENMKKLDHPNITALYEISQDDKYFYIVQELCDGIELFSEIHRRIRAEENFSEEEVRLIFK